MVEDEIRLATARAASHRTWAHLVWSIFWWVVMVGGLVLDVLIWRAAFRPVDVSGWMLEEDPSHTWELDGKPFSADRIETSAPTAMTDGSDRIAITGRSREGMMMWRVSGIQSIKLVR